MRLIAALILLTAVGLSGADLSGSDLQAIADKASSMQVGDAGSLKVTVDGKPLHVGLVLGAASVTVAGEGIASAQYKFNYVEQGLAVQATQGGRTTTMLVVNGKSSPAPAALVGAFGAGAISRGHTAQVTAAQPAAQSRPASRVHQDLNSLTYQLSR
jgi:hypothetical protein